MTRDLGYLSPCLYPRVSLLIQCSVGQSCPTLCDHMDCSLPAKLLCPWNFPARIYSGLLSNTGHYSVVSELFQVLNLGPGWAWEEVGVAWGFSEVERDYSSPSSHNRSHHLSLGVLGCSALPWRSQHLCSLLAENNQCNNRYGAHGVAASKVGGA